MGKLVMMDGAIGVVDGLAAGDAPPGVGDGSAEVVDGSDVRAQLAHLAWEARQASWVELVELAGSLGPDPELRTLSDEELDRSVRGQAARLAAETCRWLDLLAELVVRGVWAVPGCKTPAQWLSWTVGLAPSTARDHVRVGLQLRRLPRMREAFRAGRISYSKVRALTRVAVPELEPMLLAWADAATAAEIERVVAGFRQAQRGLSASADDRERSRSVFRRLAPDGMVDVVVRVPPEEADELSALLDRLVDLERSAEAEAAGDDEPGTAPQPHLALVDDGGTASEGPAAPRDAVAASTREESCPAAGRRREVADGPLVAGREHVGGRRVDALMGALVGAVAQGPPDTSGEDRHTLVLHADAHDLAEPDVPSSALVPVQDAAGRGVGMDRRVLRRLACEAGIVLVARDGNGSPVDVGRRDRRLSVALRRALMARDRSCRFPGCGATRHLHAHHVQHWADGGPTDLSNLVLVCAAHHRFVHERGWSVSPTGTGRFTFSPPDGPALPGVWPLPDRSSPDDRDDAASAEVGDDPYRLQPPHWYGPGSIDVDLAVAVLHQELNRVLPAPPIAA